MFERLTDRARKVMALANQEAQRFNHEYIGTEHILLGLVKEGSGVGANVLKNLDIDLRKVRLEVEKLVKSGPEMVTMGKLPQTPRAKKVIEYAIEEARNLNHNYVGTEHLLLGLLREHDGVAAQVLLNLGLKLEEVREEVLNLLGAGVDQEEGDDNEDIGTSSSGPAPHFASRQEQDPALDSFGRDFTELAKNGKLDPIIDRAEEIERVIQVLCRRTKNNPVLLGEAGVGKTAIVEGLAQAIIAQEVPDLLFERLVVLDLAMMVAGTKYRGQFEERIKAVMNEVGAPNVICSSTSSTPWWEPAGRGTSMPQRAQAGTLARRDPVHRRDHVRRYRKYIEKDAALGGGSVDSSRAAERRTDHRDRRINVMPTPGGDRGQRPAGGGGVLQPLHLGQGPARQVHRRDRRGGCTPSPEEHDQAPEPRRARGAHRTALDRQGRGGEERRLREGRRAQGPGREAPQGEGEVESPGGSP